MCGASSRSVPAVLAVLAVGWHAAAAFVYDWDGHHIKVVRYNTSLYIECDSASLADIRGVPGGGGPLSKVSLGRCALSSSRTLAAALAAHGVTLEPRGQLVLGYLSATPRLAAAYFLGLEHLSSLYIHGDAWHERPSPESGFLAPLRNLSSLTLWHVTLPPGELEALSALRDLRLHDVDGVEALPASAALDSLSVEGWRDARPAALTPCDSLRVLTLSKVEAPALPHGWVARCSRLERLTVGTVSGLTALPARLLEGAGALEHFSFTFSPLKALPAGLLDHSPRLRILELYQNQLRTLPSELFAVARGVQHLHLYSNQLDSRAAAALAPLSALLELDLSNNRDIGDICGTDDYSPIRNCSNLERLSLRETGVQRVCRDWREDMPALAQLDFMQTNLSALSFADLQFNRVVEAKVLLVDTPIVLQEMTREDFNLVPRGRPPGAQVLLVVADSFRLECDCHMYWMRRALEPSLAERHPAGNLPCADGRLLRDLPPEELVCARSEECAAADMPTGCACAVRPDDDSRLDRLLVRVDCENAALRGVPSARASDPSRRLYELRLRYNNISELHEEDLPDDIEALDLRNNSVRRVDEATAARLGAVRGALRLAGNPLECSCEAAPLARALRARDGASAELAEATCADGTALYSWSPAGCAAGLSVGAVLAIVLAVSLVLVVGGSVLLASRERRFFARAVLHRWGVAWRAADAEEEGARRYDAFLTFSHEDERVALELMSRLEPAYRLCVHQRDWIPGEAIGAQVARSVHNSRRTVALVSQHFLASRWACAEFQEAHAASMLDARPRLLVVLLQDPAELDMDDQLRRYVATHTYLRWGEPWFWDKLAVALPRPRARGEGRPASAHLFQGHLAPLLALEPGPARATEDTP